MTSEMKDLRYVRVDWQARAEAAEAQCARLEKALTEIATGKNAAGEAVDFFQDIARATLSDTAQESSYTETGKRPPHSWRYRRGAEDMREMAAKLVESEADYMEGHDLANYIRALPIDAAKEGDDDTV